MARLTRATQKIFAGGANNNGVFGSLQAGSGQYSNDVETIQSLPAYEQGWNAAAISSELLPPLEEFQGVQYANSYQLAYNYQEGIPEWDSGTTYYIGGVVKVITSTGYQIYHSLTDNNIGNSTSNQTYWELDFDSASGYALRNLSNSTAITNCLTEIPQDIKLELNNGTLTLKAGSKVYYPNGTGNFEELTVSSDISRATFGARSDRIFIICIVEDGSISSLSYDAVTNSSSGANEPTNGNYYNTTTNEISSYVNGEAVDRRTFPIAIVNVTNGSPSSIEQVFNGVGFMGSTIFVLPGVKGLISNGRNTDGSLNNTEFVVENLLTQTRTDLGNEFRNILINATSIVTYTTSVFSYNEIENYIVSGNNNLSYCDVGKCWSLNGKYVQQNTKMSFRAFDYNDTFNLNIPSGTIIPFAGSSAPDGFLPCNGAAISRSDYADLFLAIGTAWGTGDGSTTFHLPNLNNGRFLCGSSTSGGGYNFAGLPNITGSFRLIDGAYITNLSGAFYAGSSVTASATGGTAASTNITQFSASRANSIYGSSSTVMPNSGNVFFCIKY